MVRGCHDDFRTTGLRFTQVVISSFGQVEIQRRFGNIPAGARRIGHAINSGFIVTTRQSFNTTIPRKAWARRRTHVPARLLQARRNTVRASRIAVSGMGNRLMQAI